MVTLMSNAYDGLSDEEKERVFFLAVGIDLLKEDDENFCQQGLTVCSDDSEWTWWDSWRADQRDVFFYTRHSDGSWKFYCKYSMNEYFNEFDATIREMLEEVDILNADDDLVGNATSISEDEAGCESESESSFASSAFSLSSMFAILSSAVLGWTIV